MATAASDIQLSAKKANERIRYASEYFSEQVRARVAALMQDGYIAGTEPVTPEEELAALSQEAPMLWQQAMMGDLVAQEKLQRQLELRDQIYG